jgi:hypothetical protein
MKALVSSRPRSEMMTVFFPEDCHHNATTPQHHNTTTPREERERQRESSSISSTVYKSLAAQRCQAEDE